MLEITCRVVYVPEGSASSAMCCIALMPHSSTGGDGSPRAASTAGNTTGRAVPRKGCLRCLTSHARRWAARARVKVSAAVMGLKGACVQSRKVEWLGKTTGARQAMP
jgi:hypothetical protein